MDLIRIKQGSVYNLDQLLSIVEVPEVNGKKRYRLYFSDQTFVKLTTDKEIAWLHEFMKVNVRDIP